MSSIQSFLEELTTTPVRSEILNPSQCLVLHLFDMILLIQCQYRSTDANSSEVYRPARMFINNIAMRPSKSYLEFFSVSRVFQNHVIAS